MIGPALIAPTPGGALLTISVVLTVLAAVAVWYAERLAAPDRPRVDEAATGALGTESPAVVNLLTHDATLTAEGLRATVVDLGARGWLRLLPPETDDEVSRVRPSATAFDGDSLLPHERLVLQHVLARFTTDRAIPARHLAVDIRGPWWRRFRRLVHAEARRAGLVRRRWTPVLLAAPLVTTFVAFLAWNGSRDDGGDLTAVVDSLERRAISIAVLVAIVLLAVRIVRHAVGPELAHTDQGFEVATSWLAVRRRLVEGGFTVQAPSSNELGDRRLAYATAMGLAEGAAVELPMARENHRLVWSAVGGRGRLVTVRYPWRLGYGIAPVVALTAGVAGVLVGVIARRWFAEAARRDRWGSLYDRFEDQDWLVSGIATAGAAVAFVVVLGSIWLAVAGGADLFNSIERTGVVVRARRPAEVSPVPRRILRKIEPERYTVYVAVDDGRASTITAFKTGERGAMPQGADVIVRATPILGHIRSSLPIGHLIPDD